MTVNKKLRGWFRWQSGMMVILFLLIGLLGFLAQEFRVHWDISQNGRNTLSQVSIDILEKLDGPVQVAVFATRHRC